MALIIVFQNTSDSLPANSDYDYTVQVNDRVIEKGVVLQHIRADGWVALVRKMLEQKEHND